MTISRRIAAFGMTLALMAGAPAWAAGGPSVDATPIVDLVAKPETRAVLDKHLPGLRTNMMYGRFKGMTLKALADKSGGRITDAKLASVQADLDKLR